MLSKKKKNMNEIVSLIVFIIRGVIYVWGYTMARHPLNFYSKKLAIFYLILLHYQRVSDDIFLQIQFKKKKCASFKKTVFWKFEHLLTVKNRTDVLNVYCTVFRFQIDN